MKYAAIITILFLVSCAHRPANIVLPDGSRGWVISCKKAVHTCYKHAGQFCPNGYDFVDKDKLQNSQAFGTADKNSAIYSASATTMTTFVIKCKEPKPAVVEPVKLESTKKPTPGG